MHWALATTIDVQHSPPVPQSSSSSTPPQTASIESTIDIANNEPQDNPESHTTQKLTQQVGIRLLPASSAKSTAQQLQLQVLTLQKQLSDALAAKTLLDKQLQGIAGPARAAGSLPSSEIDKLSLRLHKAEKALEHERGKTESLRQQLDAQQSAAEIGSRAAATISQLQAELAAARSLAAQRTSEGEALQRAVRLNDETVSRLQQQLEGLLAANQAAVSREQELERKLSELQSQLTQQQAAHKQQLATQQHKQPDPQELIMLQAGMQQLQQENEQLKSMLAQQEAALVQARSECARKDAGIHALEALLAQHGHSNKSPAFQASTRAPPTTHMASPQPPLEKEHVAVTIDILSAPTDQQALRPVVGGYESLVGGLTDNQWKLVMLSAEVRKLRDAVAKARHAVGQPLEAGQEHSYPAQKAQRPGMDGQSAAVWMQSGVEPSEDHNEIVEVDLPPDVVDARVQMLAQQMRVLEEELQQLTGRSQSPGAHGDALQKHNDEARLHQEMQQPGSDQHQDITQQQSKVFTPTRHASNGKDFKTADPSPQTIKKAQRKGWFGWLSRNENDSIV